LAPLGEGTFGKVSKIMRIEDGEILVWKELYYGRMNEKEKQQLVAEVNILRELQHKHVVRYWDRIIDRENKKIYIVMEYCSGGDVAGIIKEHLRNRTWADEEFIWKILAEVASALAECHRKTNNGGTILHRDLKPANIFLDSPTTQCVKLGDFGLARTLKDSFDYAKTHVGTPFYMSPEQVMETRYNAKSDIWSLGCLIYELAALQPPFKATNHLALATKIRSGYFDRLPRHYSNELEQVVRSMIRVDANKRPNIDQLLQHPKIAAKLTQERIREEREIRDVQQSIKQAQQRLDAELASLSKRAEELARKEAALEIREKKLREREAALDKREVALMTTAANGSTSTHHHLHNRAPLQPITSASSNLNNVPPTINLPSYSTLTKPSILSARGTKDYALPTVGER